MSAFLPIQFKLGSEFELLAYMGEKLPYQLPAPLAVNAIPCAGNSTTVLATRLALAIWNELFWGGKVAPLT